ncbi:MAG TPA: hypothetical protein VLE97_08905 [Gaiellaceae bacterium]|nr:hypothetical protein [Gaiellaceae bacterium]
MTSTNGDAVTRALDEARRDERRKMGVEGLNKLIDLREAFGSDNREVILALQSWFTRAAQS